MGLHSILWLFFVYKWKFYFFMQTPMNRIQTHQALKIAKNYNCVRKTFLRSTCLSKNRFCCTRSVEEYSVIRRGDKRMLSKVVWTNITTPCMYTEDQTPMYKTAQFSQCVILIQIPPGLDPLKKNWRTVGLMSQRLLVWFNVQSGDEWEGVLWGKTNMTYLHIPF